MRFANTPSTILRCAAFSLAFIFSSPDAGSAHDLTGILNELADPVVQAVADPETQFRMRIFQMTGRDIAGQETATGEFSRDDRDDIEQIFLQNYRWDQGKVLRICFFDGNSSQRNAVISVVEEIISYTNLGAMVSTSNCPVRDADIQIRFASNGCFSYYGRMAAVKLNQDRNYHTMGLCNVSGRAAAELGTIRHEFMHALGAVHEQQHDEQRCYDQLDLQKVSKKLFGRLDAESQREALVTNILGVRNSVPNAQIARLPYDKTSVMHYRLEGDLFKDPARATCVLAKKNNQLSAGDKRILSMMYPPGR